MYEKLPTGLFTVLYRMFCLAAICAIVYWTSWALAAIVLAAYWCGFWRAVFAFNLAIERGEGKTWQRIPAQQQ